MLRILAFLAPGLLAAGVSWCGNSFLLNFFDEKKVAVYLAPAIEELAKTGFAVLLGAPVWAAHLVFGLAEAFRDFTESRARGFAAGLASLIGHGVFGLVAFLVLGASGAFFLAVGTCWIFHLGWNVFVYRLK
ncbi:MAG: hypothetical protein ACUVSK_04420 [Desulfotomaculales bacterium]